MILRNRGMNLVEILIGCAIIVTGIVALINAYGLYVKYALTHDKDTQATYLLEEGLEAVSLLRDKGWTSNVASLTASTTYGLYFNGSLWTTSSTTEYIDSTFYRTVALYNVTRDGADKIASSGTLDPNTKKVTVTVSYPQSSGTTTQTLSKYLTNLYAN